jgi:DtxR family Mn-dependent transcriptional regulator
MAGRTTYLLALYIAEHRRSPPVSPGTVAEFLDRSPAATTEMFERLAADGLVSQEPYEGVQLTPAGREIAAEQHEAYVTLSWFFRTVLDLEEYEPEALELAGVVSPTVTDRLAETLPVETDETGDDTEGNPSNSS